MGPSLAGSRPKSPVRLEDRNIWLCCVLSVYRLERLETLCCLRRLLIILLTLLKNDQRFPDEIRFACGCVPNIVAMAATPFLALQLVLLLASRAVPVLSAEFTHDRKRIGPLESVRAEYGCLKKFDVSEKTIIRTLDSQDLGAKFLEESDVGNREDCLSLCCKTPHCNVAVFEEKVRGLATGTRGTAMPRPGNAFRSRHDLGFPISHSLSSFPRSRNSPFQS